MKSRSLAIYLGLTLGGGVGLAAFCAGLALAQNDPDAAATGGAPGAGFAGGMGQGMGQGRGAAFRQRLQAMSPDERKAAMTRIMQMRAGRGEGKPQPTAPQGNYDLRADVAYGPEPLEKMDIYSPKNASGAPIVFFVHGGGWAKGDKASRDNTAKGAAYTAEGVVLISVNYGLAPQTMHPKQIGDIAAAFDYVKKHATEFGGDPKRIFLMGHSAGAHLVDLLATNDRFLAANGDGLGDIRGVVSLDTASLDLNTRIGDDSFEGGMVGDMITTAFGKDPKVLADGSPATSIKAGKQYPPFLMYCGSSRRTCCAQHDVFSAALKKVGGSVTVQRIPLSHREINMHSGEPGAEIFQAVVKMVKS